jgi:RimJ/RimL family protein N-acetyltransferase
MRYLAPGGQLQTHEDSVERLRRYRAHWERYGFGIWVVEELATGRMVGRVGLAHHVLLPDEVEVGWALDPTVWGRGYATEGARAALNYAFTTLDLDRVVSIVHPENAASIAVMARLGLRPWTTVPWPEAGVDLEVRAIERAEWAQSPA